MTLKTNRLENLAGDKGLETARIVEGSAKAWFNLNALTATFRDSYNVSSIVDVGTGNFRVSFSNAMRNDGYSATGSSGAVGSIRIISTTGAVLPTPSTLSFYTANVGGTLLDNQFCSVALQGGLA